MANTSDPEHNENSPPPKIQEFFERPILLLVLGLATMLVFYTLWGIWEIVSLPESTLP